MHTLYILYTFYVSSYYHICVLILLCMRRHTTMCPQTTLYVSAYSYICYKCPDIYRSMSPSSYTFVLILLYVSSYSYTCYMCPHTSIYVFSYSYTCVLILLYMCPHPPIHVSAYLLYAEQVIVAHIRMLAASKACQQLVKSAYLLYAEQVIVARVTRRKRIYVCVLILL